MNNEANSSVGYMKVISTSGGGEFPIEGSVVYITDYNDDDGKLIYTLRTGENGMTRTVALPTVPISKSLTPGNDTPYSLYNVKVIKDGYYPQESIGVPIFEGVVSIQSFALQPLTETDLVTGDNRTIVNYEVIDAPRLQGAGHTEESQRKLADLPDNPRSYGTADMTDLNNGSIAENNNSAASEGE